MCESPKPASQHFGALKVRGRWIATYVSSKEIASTDFRTGEPSTRWLHRFVVDHNVAIWWTGKKLDLTQGELITIVASVKEHAIWQPGRGQPIKQTVLTRCDIHPVDLCSACGHPLIDKDKRCPGCKSKDTAMVPVDLFDASEIPL